MRQSVALSSQCMALVIQICAVLGANETTNPTARSGGCTLVYSVII